MGFVTVGARGTVKGVPDEEFDPEGAAQKLYNGMKGLGTDENALIDVFGGHTNVQRQVIKEKYKTMFGKELIDDLKDELGGNFEKVILALLQDPEDYLVDCVQNAIKGLGTDEYTLTGLLCGRSNEELNEMKLYYQRKFGNDMEEEVADDVSGDFKNFMVSLMSAGRDESEDVDLDKVKKDAQDLFEAGEGLLGTREEVFNAIFNQRNSKHMREVFDTYKDLADGNEMESAIESEFSGSLKTAYLAMVQIFRNPVVFYAERLRSALKGAGTDDAALVQLLVTRSEIDLEDIAEYYEIKYEQSLADAVSSDTSGDYRSILLRLLGK